MGALAVVVVGACGQKGPLYLPEPTGEVVTRPTQTPPSQTPEREPDTEEPESDETTDPPR